MKIPAPRSTLWTASIVAITMASASLWAQYAVRPDDPLGLSIRERRVRIVHSTTPDVPGTSMHLQATDPWLMYQRGRSYFFREWSREDGIFAALPDRPEAATANSCGICHNLPFPSAGSGGNVGIKVGVGRSAPHLFGAGLLETLGVQIRAQILSAYDTNHNGFIDVPAESVGKRAIVEATPGVTLDFGSLEDLDGDGAPDLNPALMIRMVTESGQRVLFDEAGRVSRLGDPGIVGYDLAVGVFSSSAGDHQFPSLRTFATGVFTTIMGIVPESPASTVQPELYSGGHLLMNWGHFSNAGAFQSEVMLVGDATDTTRSHRASITEGELDMLEWFQMNHPSPALGKQTDETRRGRVSLEQFGCTTCHLPRWTILPADPRIGLPGDRRFFDLAVTFNPRTERLEGSLRMLTRETVDAGRRLLLPRREGFVIDDVFSDLLHHDVGERFYEYDYVNGTLYVKTQFRTAPLWGVGATAPYGHDGRSLSLDDVIRRHGGEAESSVNAYRRATPAQRHALLAFLSSLVLYQPDLLPTDLDGDQRIAESYRVDGVDLGPEIFRPELLFRVKPKYRGWTTGPDGGRYFSRELLNERDAYGEDFEALRDSVGDGWPDVSRKKKPDPPR